MYQPLPHRQDQLEAQHALIRSHPLGLLISHGAQGLEPIQFLSWSIRRPPSSEPSGAYGARERQWRSLSEASDVLVVFQGPDHYITPSWYATKQETGKVVPTWNYVMVQARGRPRVIEDPVWLRRQIEALTRSQESARPRPGRSAMRPKLLSTCRSRRSSGSKSRSSTSPANGKSARTAPSQIAPCVMAGLDAMGDEASREMAAIVRGAAGRKGEAS